MSLRHNMCVCKADSKDEVYILEADLVGRTIVMRNKNDEIVAVAALSNKAMMMKVALGSGSETVVDVAPGVDWTAVCAIMMGVQQVGASYLKDLFAMFVIDPLQDAVVDGMVEALGAEELMQKATHATNSLIHKANEAKRLEHEFNKRV